MLQQLHNISGNSRFLQKAWDRELGGLGYPTACFLKHSSVAKTVWGVQGLPWAAAEGRNNRGLLTQRSSPREIPSPGLAGCCNFVMTLCKVLWRFPLGRACHAVTEVKQGTVEILLGIVKQSERLAEKLSYRLYGEWCSRGLQQAGSGLKMQMKVSKEDGLRCLENEDMSRVQSLYRKTPFSEVPQRMFPPEAL